jgi:glutamate synthase domain-containing protein 2
MGEDSISPNRHVEVNSVEQLIDMIQHIRQITGKPVGIKFVLGAYGWLDELCNAIHARGLESAPDFITLDSADGGSGAAPMSLMDYMGLPLKESLPMLVEVLKRHRLKERIRVIVSGKLITPAEAAWAFCVGADFVTSARGFMFSLGCIQALQCNRNTCPTGITTHNPRLQKGLDPTLKAVRVENYVRNMVHEIGVIAHSCGVHEPREFRPFHALVMTDDGHSISLEDLYQHD